MKFILHPFPCGGRAMRHLCLQDITQASWPWIWWVTETEVYSSHIFVWRASSEFMKSRQHAGKPTVGVTGDRNWSVFFTWQTEVYSSHILLWRPSSETFMNARQHAGKPTVDMTGDRNWRQQQPWVTDLGEAIYQRSRKLCTKRRSGYLGAEYLSQDAFNELWLTVC